MKKMTIAFAFALGMTIMAQAAATSWSISNIYLPTPTVLTPTGTSPFATTATSGLTMSLYVVSGTLGDTFLKTPTVTADKASTGNLFADTAAAQVYSKNAAYATGGTKETLTFRVNYVYVTVDGTYTATKANTANFYNVANAAVPVNINNGGVTWSYTAAVPEPTSMALLALGVAALGLRRKMKK